MVFLAGVITFLNVGIIIVTHGKICLVEIPVVLYQAVWTRPLLWAPKQWSSWIVQFLETERPILERPDTSDWMLEQTVSKGNLNFYSFEIKPEICQCSTTFQISGFMSTQYQFRFPLAIKSTLLREFSRKLRIFLVSVVRFQEIGTIQWIFINIEFQMAAFQGLLKLTIPLDISTSLKILWLTKIFLNDKKNVKYSVK